MYGNVEVLEQMWYIYIYRLKNENIQICNKMNVGPSAKHVTSSIANIVKDINYVMWQ